MTPQTPIVHCSCGHALTFSADISAVSVRLSVGSPRLPPWWTPVRLPSTDAYERSPTCHVIQHKIVIKNMPWCTDCKHISNHCNAFNDSTFYICVIVLGYASLTVESFFFLIIKIVHNNASTNLNSNICVWVRYYNCFLNTKTCLCTDNNIYHTQYGNNDIKSRRRTYDI